MMSDSDNIERVNLDAVDWRGSREFFESLTAALEKLDDKDESYDFTWVGKRKAIIEAGAPINKTFRPDVAASKNWGTTENLFIEGDNLDALKLLQESYLGKVKMIYIDPPYNTGGDFVYRDDFRINSQEYDEATDYRDENGNINYKKKNEKNNGRYHSDWLSMMYPRLKLARNLLSEDGVIFISIDYNENYNLRQMCNDIFGEDQFVGEIYWESKTKSQNTETSYNKLQPKIEMILVYSRQEKRRFNLVSTGKKEYPLADEQGAYREYPLEVMNATGVRGRKTMIYAIHDILPPEGKQWKLGQDQVATYDNSGNLIVRDGKIIIKMRPGEERGETTDPFWGFFGKDIGTAESAKKELKELVGEHDFETVKPVELIKRLASHTTSKDDIIADFFSGSATTSHAITELNVEDGGVRRWIVVQLPEEAAETSILHKRGFKTIPEFSRYRIGKAVEKIATTHPDAKIDYGFRALTIADTNYKDVYKPAGQLQQGDLLASVNNVKEDRTDLDLLYGVLTQSALELNRPINTTEIAGATIYRYDYVSEASGLIACFAKDAPEEAIKAIAALKPLTAVFRDSSFANSQAKVNLSEHFRILSPDTRIKVI